MTAQPDPRPVLVTGATGFLGERVAAALVSQGATLRLLTRRTPATPAGDVVIGDVRDAPAVQRASRGCRAIVHLAARVTRGGRREDFDEVNVQGLRNVLSAAAANASDVHRIVYASSLFALGPSGSAGERGLDESVLDRLAEGGRDIDHYQGSKRAAAMIARDAARLGAPLVTLFPGVLIGPGRMTEANILTTMIRDHLAGGLVAFPAGGSFRWSLVHVDDVARGHALALERGVPGASYCLGGENRTLREMFAIVSELTGRRGPRLSAPAAMMWSVGAGEELLELVLGRAPKQLTRGAARMLTREWTLCSDRAAAELDWHARPLRQAIGETIAWLEAEGHLPRGTLRVDTGPS